MTRLPMAERIKRGAAFLGRKIGKKWRSKIDRKTLDINLPQSCMLGQTDTDFFKHKRKLKLSDLQCAHLGFLGYDALGPDNKINYRNTSLPRGVTAAVIEHRKLTAGWQAYLLLEGLE